MSQTNIGIGSTLAVRRWGTSLALDTEKQSYWTKFIGKGENNVIERKVELESDAGDTVQFDLSMRLRGGVVTGDNRVEGQTGSLDFLTDEIKVDQARKGVDTGGRMTRKRTLHNLRTISRDRVSEFMAQWVDEGFFAYLSGDAGLTAINEDRVFREVNFAGNAQQAPDAFHMVYPNAVTSKASLTAADKMSVGLIEKVSTVPRMLNAKNPDLVNMTGVMIEGGKHFIMLMNPWQEHDLRTETGDLSWSKIAQAAATAEGRKSPIFKGGMGMINNTVLHKHESVLRWNDAGAGGNIRMARALFLGRQAGVVAYGSAGNGARMSWYEKEADAGNRVEIYCGCIMGMKKTRFDGFDFSVVAVDTAARDPVAA
jgi:N4-gp56 family major capsid protein